jgi:hypothetical protein
MLNLGQTPPLLINNIQTSHQARNAARSNDAQRKPDQTERRDTPKQWTRFPRPTTGSNRDKGATGTSRDKPKESRSDRGKCLCSFCGSFDHPRELCFDYARQVNRKHFPEKFACRQCQAVGKHLTSQCPEKHAILAKILQSPVCARCTSPGHFSAHCPNERRIDLTKLDKIVEVIRPLLNQNQSINVILSIDEFPDEDGVYGHNPDSEDGGSDFEFDCVDVIESKNL